MEWKITRDVPKVLWVTAVEQNVESSSTMTHIKVLRLANDIDFA